MESVPEHESPTKGVRSAPGGVDERTNEAGEAAGGGGNGGDKDFKKAEIKRLAAAGKFDEIAERFGAKYATKAREYIEKKGGKPGDSGDAKTGDAETLADAAVTRTPEKDSGTDGPTPPPPSTAKTPPTNAAGPVKAVLGVGKAKPRALAPVAAKSAPAPPAPPLESTPPSASLTTTEAPKAAPNVAVAKRKPASTRADEPADAKRPLSAFMLFAQEERPRILAANPGAAFADVGRLLGQAWKVLPEAARERFTTQAALLKDASPAPGSATPGAGDASKANPMKKKKKKPVVAVPASASKRARPDAATSTSKPTLGLRRGLASPSTPSTTTTNPVRKVGPLVEFGDGRVFTETGDPVWANSLDSRPRDRTPMDLSAFAVDVGDSVVLVVPAYVAFLERFADAARASADLGFKGTFNLLKHKNDAGLVHARVAKIRAVGPSARERTAAEDSSSRDDAGISSLPAGWSVVDLVVPADEAESATRPRDAFAVMWIPAESPDLDVSAHLVRRDAFEKAMAAKIQPGTQIQALFASRDDPTVAEVYEGRVYHVGPSDAIAADFPASPFASLRVVWYDQDANSLQWRPDLQQTDNELSPWEVRVESRYVRPENLRAFCTESVVLGSASQVAAYLAQTEASLPFREDPPKSEAEYYRKIKHPISLRTITAKARRGAYEGEAVESLWEDLRVLIKNAKTFNQPERWEWRAADMLTYEVRRVREAFTPGDTGSHSMTALIPRVRVYAKGFGPHSAGGARRRLLKEDRASSNDLSEEAQCRLQDEVFCKLGEGRPRRGAALSAHLAIAAQSLAERASSHSKRAGGGGGRRKRAREEGGEGTEEPKDAEGEGDVKDEDDDEDSESRESESESSESESDDDA